MICLQNVDYCKTNLCLQIVIFPANFGDYKKFVLCLNVLSSSLSNFGDTPSSVGLEVWRRRIVEVGDGRFRFGGCENEGFWIEFWPMCNSVLLTYYGDLWGMLRMLLLICQDKTELSPKFYTEIYTKGALRQTSKPILQTSNRENNIGTWPWPSLFLRKTKYQFK